MHICKNDLDTEFMIHCDHIHNLIGVQISTYYSFYLNTYLFEWVYALISYYYPYLFSHSTKEDKSRFHLQDRTTVIPPK